MKFRNKETGEVFSTITEAWTAFMCPGPCGDCNLRRGSTCEKEWIEAHPHEAARLMGYEVVYEPGDDAVPLDMLADTFNEIGKEANMDKPRICEVLGVEPEERFDAGPYKDAYVDLRGTIRMNIGLLMDADRVCELINHPERIIRKPRFTEQEVERAKAIKIIWPNADRIQCSSGAFGITLYYVWFSSVLLGQINEDDCFPSIGSEETVTLDDIIGGAE